MRARPLVNTLFKRHFGIVLDPVRSSGIPLHLGPQLRKDLETLHRLHRLREESQEKVEVAANRVAREKLQAFNALYADHVREQATRLKLESRLKNNPNLLKLLAEKEKEKDKYKLVCHLESTADLVKTEATVLAVRELLLPICHKIIVMYALNGSTYDNEETKFAHHKETEDLIRLAKSKGFVVTLLVSRQNIRDSQNLEVSKRIQIPCYGDDMLVAKLIDREHNSNGPVALVNSVKELEKLVSITSEKELDAFRPSIERAVNQEAVSVFRPK